MKEEKLHKIAIVETADNYAYYSDNCDEIIKKITDFSIVDEKTYRLLLNAQHKYNFKIIQQPIDQDAFILDTVEKYAIHVKREEERIAKEKAALELKKQEAAAKKALRKKLKDEKDEKVLLAELLAKHGKPE